MENQRPPASSGNCTSTCEETQIPIVFLNKFPKKIYSNRVSLFLFGADKYSLKNKTKKSFLKI